MGDGRFVDRPSRRGLFTILQTAAAGCAACMAVKQCPAQNTAGWASKADVSLQDMFRFVYQKDIIPLMKDLEERIGKEQFIEMLKESSTRIVERKSAARPPMPFDFAKLVAGFKNPPPLIRQALVAEPAGETENRFEYKVTQCLWAKTFRDGDAADLGYAIVCHPDFAVARALSPKLKLTRNGTLMQGAAFCDFRYEMES